jgi:molecular chaperone DnaJ
MRKRDYYEVLGVARGADDDALKKAFRRLAKQYHPDANKEQGAEARFIEINEAYETLSDPGKRAAYDRYGHAFATNGLGVDQAAAAGNHSASFFSGGAGQPRHTAQQRGPDNRYVLTIAFEEAAFGCQKEIELPRWEPCPSCRGRGAQPGTPAARCGSCQGTGEARRVQSSIFGRYVNATPCERCGGAGTAFTIPCEACKGLGRVRTSQCVVVAIPAGVDDGVTVRVIGEGESGAQGTAAGNLYVTLRVKPHEFFVRRGNDIICELPISIALAALGAEVEVPTADNRTASLTIPAGTQSGAAFRLRGLGVPILYSSSARGDQYIIVRVVTPTGLGAERKSPLDAYARHERGQRN